MDGRERIKEKCLICMKRLFETMDDPGMFLDYLKVALPTEDVQ